MWDKLWLAFKFGNPKFLQIRDYRKATVNRFKNTHLGLETDKSKSVRRFFTVKENFLKRRKIYVKLSTELAFKI